MFQIKNPKEFLSFIPDRYIWHYECMTLPSFSILIMEKTGGAFCRISIYEDDSTTVWLDYLTVDPEFRSKGIGTELQIIREEIGRRLGAKSSCLKVKIGSWMHDWYRRRDYIDCTDIEDYEGYRWMCKQL